MRFSDNAELTAANMTGADILAGTDVSSGDDKKFTLNGLGEWFVERYTGSTIDGQEQTPKAAIEAAGNKFIEYLPTDTASGAIASFPDGADTMPLKSLVIDIDPVQDLHGYENPWPAGGGKNFWPVFVNQSKNDVALTYDNGVIKLNGLCSQAASFGVDAVLPAGTYTISCGYSGTLPDNGNARIQVYKADVVDKRIQNNDSASAFQTFTLSEADTIQFRIRIDNGFNYQNLLLYPQIETGSTASAFATRSNLCPITGHTGADVYARGKNMTDFSNVSIAAGVQETTALGSVFLKAGTYTLSYTLSTTVTATRNRPEYAINGVYTYGSDIKTAGRGSWTFTLANDATLEFAWWAHTLSAAATISDFQLEPGSTATTYEAPQPASTLPISWQSEAGTVYGGTDEVVSGGLRVKRVIETHSWSDFSGNTDFDDTSRRYINLLNDGVDVDPDCLSNVAPIGSGYSSDFVHFYISANSDRTRAYMFLPKNTPENTQIQICYSLATPITYTLTPTQIDTILGQNNIWADTGDVEVEYYADTKLYINKIVAALA